MLRLSSIAQRIERLESEEYDDDSEKLATWRAMVRWRFGDKSVYISPWWVWTFDDLLPSTGSDGWRLEKIEIVLSMVTDLAINECGYSQFELENALDEVLELAGKILTDDSQWTEFYQSKKDESERHELRHKYRGAASRGELDSAGIEWLQLNDVDFWTNYVSKGNENITDSGITLHDIIDTRITPHLTQQVGESPSPVNDVVEVGYFGLDPQGSLSVTCASGASLPVWRNRVYIITAEQWANIQTDEDLKRVWKKIEQRPF